VFVVQQIRIEMRGCSDKKNIFGGGQLAVGQLEIVKDFDNALMRRELLAKSLNVDVPS